MNFRKKKYIHQWKSVLGLSFLWSLFFIDVSMLSPTILTRCLSWGLSIHFFTSASKFSAMRTLYLTVDVWDRHSSSLFNLENPYKRKYSAYYDLRIREIFIVYNVKVNLHGSEKSPRFSLRGERGRRWGTWWTSIFKKWIISRKRDL